MPVAVFMGGGRIPASVRLALLSVVVSACATTRPSTILPLTKVRLYETGVGYFERSGHLDGQVARLPVPENHLDDALKSLVVFGRDAAVGNVSFDSRMSPAVARARAGLPADHEETVDFLTVLSSLKGQAVVARLSNGRLHGRVVDLVVRDASPEKEPKGFAVFLTDEGELTRVNLGEVRGVTPVDAEIRARYAAALSASRDVHGGRQKGLGVLGAARGNVTLGYLAEAPVWRATYRLVFESGGATLQGWALVHNDTDEDWRGVALELVNGRPDSFLYPLAAPRYERRDLVSPPRELSSVPQLLDSTPDAMWGDFVGESFGIGGLGVGGGGSGSGYGRGYGALLGHGRGAAAGLASSDLVKVGKLAKAHDAAAHELPTVFVYQATQPLHLRAHHSAMVSILHSDFAATRISVLAGFDQFQVRHGLLLENNTKRTLPGGTIAVFAEGGFSGETSIDRVKPRERRFVTIGDDLDTEVRVSDKHVTETTKRVVYRNRALEEHFAETTRYDLRLTNRSAHARRLYVLAGKGRNVDVVGASRIDYDVASDRMFAVLGPAPGTRDVELSVQVTKGLTRRTPFGNITSGQVRTLAERDTLPAAERAALRALLGRSEARESARAAHGEARQRVETLEQDLERLRAHLDALGEGGAAAQNPIVTRLLATEDALAKARLEVTQIDGKIKTADEAFEEGLAALGG